MERDGQVYHRRCTVRVGHDADVIMFYRLHDALYHPVYFGTSQCRCPRIEARHSCERPCFMRPVR